MCCSLPKCKGVNFTKNKKGKGVFVITFKSVIIPSSKGDKCYHMYSSKGFEKEKTKKEEK